MKTILAIGAHYDDIEIGCGGTLLKHSLNGDRVILAITSCDESLTGEPRIRFKEQEESLNKFGLSTNSECLSLSLIGEDIPGIIGELDKFKPDIIFVQHDKDTHQDHVKASIIGKAVGRKRNITTFFYDSGSTYEFQPNIFSVIDFVFKYDLLKCFKSQIDCKAINIDIVKKKNAYWASLISNDPDAFAEGFIVRKMKWRV